MFNQFPAAFSGSLNGIVRSGIKIADAERRRDSQIEAGIDATIGGDDEITFAQNGHDARAGRDVSARDDAGGQGRVRL